MIRSPNCGKRGLRGFLSGIAILAYVFAQFAGLAHASTHHLSDRGAAHGTLCVDCLAAAEATGGPPSAVPVREFAVERVGVLTVAPVLRRREAVQTRYRSRAPPDPI